MGRGTSGGGKRAVGGKGRGGRAKRPGFVTNIRFLALIRLAGLAETAGTVAVRRVSWPAAYGRIVAPEIIEQALARVDAARLRARLAGQPWRHTLVAEHEPAPAPDPTAPPVPVITGYASYGIERGVDGHPQQICAAGGQDADDR